MTTIREELLKIERSLRKERKRSKIRASAIKSLKRKVSRIKISKIKRPVFKK